MYGSYGTYVNDEYVDNHDYDDDTDADTDNDTGDNSDDDINTHIIMWSACCCYCYCYCYCCCCCCCCCCCRFDWWAFAWFYKGDKIIILRGSKERCLSRLEAVPGPKIHKCPVCSRKSVEYAPYDRGQLRDHIHNVSGGMQGPIFWIQRPGIPRDP